MLLQEFVGGLWGNRPVKSISKIHESIELLILKMFQYCLQRVSITVNI
jgi:hypothetical protein